MKMCIYIFFLFVAGNVFAQDDTSTVKKEKTWAVSGYVKNLNSIAVFPNDSTLQSGLIHNRIKFLWDINRNFTTTIELRNRILYGENVRKGFFPSEILDKDNGLADATFLPFDYRSAKAITSVERFWLRYSRDKFEVTVGRQRVNWGLNLVWNPNDLFNTYSFLDFDYEEKPGRDAIRLSYATGEMSSLEIAASPGKFRDDDVYAAKYKFNKRNYDFQFIGAVYCSDLVAGFGWAGSIKNVGFKGEASYFIPYDTPPDTAGILNTAVEFDYTIDGKVYINASYLYYNKGAQSKNSFSTLQFFANGNVNPKMISPATHSGFVQFRSIFSPVITFSLSAIYLFGVNAMYVIPEAIYSIDENWETSLHLQSFWNDNNKFESGMNNIILRLKYVF